MSVVGVTYYQALCDRCNENVTAMLTGDEYSAWVGRDETLEHLDGCLSEGHFFTADGEIVLCEGCANDYRANLPDDEWDSLADKTPEALEALCAWLAAEAKP